MPGTQAWCFLSTPGPPEVLGTLGGLGETVDLSPTAPGSPFAPLIPKTWAGATGTGPWGRSAQMTAADLPRPGSGVL